MRALTAATLAMALAACAPAATTTATGNTTMSTTTPTSTAAAVNPVGAYNVIAVVNGQDVTGTLEIMGTPGAYTGRMVTSAFPEFTVRSATATGQEMTVVLATPQGDATFRMTFTGAAFTGGWMLGGDSGPLRGQRTR